LYIYGTPSYIIYIASLHVTIFSLSAITPTLILLKKKETTSTYTHIHTYIYKLTEVYIQPIHGYV